MARDSLHYIIKCVFIVHCLKVEVWLSDSIYGSMHMIRHHLALPESQTFQYPPPHILPPAIEGFHFEIHLHVVSPIVCKETMVMYVSAYI